MSDFAEALALVLVMEGGRVDDPRDPGGRTNQGVTQRTYDAWRQRQGQPKRSVYGIAADEVRAIYRDDFARALEFDHLPHGIAYAVLDAGVHSGPARAIGWLQAAVGRPTTGHLDAAALAAVAGQPPAPVIERLCNLRLGLLRRLPGWAPFGRGWRRRIAFVRSHALAMAASTARTA